MKVYGCEGLLRPKVKRYWITERYPQRRAEGQDIEAELKRRSLQRETEKV